MKRRNRPVALVLLLLFFLVSGLGTWWYQQRPSQSEIPAPAPETQPTQVPLNTPINVRTPRPIPMDLNVDLEQGLDSPQTTATPKPVPENPHLKAADDGLHKELIPKDIRIVRLYYDQPITGPDSVIRLNLNGTGFTSEFQKMIAIETGALDIKVENLRLVTANQIQGDVVVGPAALTAFVKLEVKIRNLPVFRSRDPLAVVRPGDVLTIQIANLDETGRSGRIEALTNLTPDQFKRFKIEATQEGIEVSSLVPNLPFVVEGVVSLERQVPLKAYGFTASIGNRSVYKSEGEYRIVRPNVGKTGFIQSVQVDERFHRPKDRVAFIINGSSLKPSDASLLQIEIVDAGKLVTQAVYLSPSQIRAEVQLPESLSEKAYDLRVLNNDGKVLHTKPGAVTIVPKNWIKSIRAFPAARPGGNSQLRISGRDLSPEYAKTLQLSAEEKGLQISNLRFANADLVTAELAVTPTVVPGDYVLELSVDGKSLQPPGGTVIRVRL